MCLPLMDSMKTDVDSAYVWSVAGALELQGEVQRPGQDPGHFHRSASFCFNIHMSKYVNVIFQGSVPAHPTQNHLVDRPQVQNPGTPAP